MNMKNLSLRLTSIAVFTSIAVLSVFQYRWAVSSGEKTIRDLAQTTSIRIFAVVTQELSHLDIFDHDPKPPEKGDIAIEDFRESLESMLVQFHQSYNGDYIVDFSYTSGPESNEGYTYVDGEWVSSTITRISSRNLNSSDEQTDFRDIKIFKNSSTSELIQMIHVFPGSNSQVLITFNLQKFLEREIIPVIDASFTESTLQWQKEQPEDAIELNERGYNFSPITTLFSYLTGNSRNYYLRIPYLRIPFLRFNRNFPMKQFNMNQNDFLYLTLYSDSGESLYFERELGFAIQWLTGLILLLGIGAAYSLILYQRNRLTRLRQREKEFVASVTHELRTPLTVIHSAADNIQSGILTQDRLVQYGDLIKDQSGRLSSMIEGILLFSRLEGKAEQPPPLNPLKFEDLRNDLEIFSQSLSSGSKVSFDFASLPGEARTDRETLELVLTNLISNSLRHGYNPEDDGSVRVTGHLKLPKTLVFTVEDDGFGIPTKEKKHIFDPFFRGERSLSQQIKGSGLGLYLVSRKIKIMGGSITVESPYMRADGKTRKGCRFTINLPYSETAEQENRR